jgi:DNA replication and repair protein RecF
MRLREVELDEFRSFRSLRLAIDPAGFRAVGPNASGKSTLLEAIAMLATTRSPRTASEREIAHWASGTDLGLPPYARSRGVFERLDGPHAVEIGLTIDERGSRSLKKSIRLDDRPVRAVDAVGQFKTILFSPEDVDLLAGAPSGRRRYLDIAVSQANRGYLRALSRYGRVLEQRNSLLRTLSRDRVAPGSPRSAGELAFWDAELTAAAVDVIAVRLGAIGILSARASAHFAALTGGGALRMTYLPARIPLHHLSTADGDWQAPPQSVRQALAAAFASSLEAATSEELRRGVTAIGPHRDDFTVANDGVDLGRFGSRGQQRLAVIAIKLAELDLLQASGGEPPVLLLDDVLSELDQRHRAQIVSALASRDAQICVTSTERGDLGSAMLDHLPLLQTGNGTVVSLDAG